MGNMFGRNKSKFAFDFDSPAIGAITGRPYWIKPAAIGFYTQEEITAMNTGGRSGYMGYFEILRKSGGVWKFVSREYAHTPELALERFARHVNTNERLLVRNQESGAIFDFVAKVPTVVFERI